MFLPSSFIINQLTLIFKLTEHLVAMWEVSGKKDVIENCYPKSIKSEDKKQYRYLILIIINGTI
jgi:hypothetical protein